MRPDQPDLRNGHAEGSSAGPPPLASAPHAPSLAEPAGSRIRWAWWLGAAFVSVLLWWLILRLVT